MIAPHQRGTSVLFSEVLNGMDRLLRGEVALAKAEVRQNLRSVRQAALQFVLAVVFGVIALNILAGSAVAALIAAGLSPGFAALTLGVVLLLAAYGCAQWGIWLLDTERLTPKRTFQNLGKDFASLKAAGPGKRDQTTMGESHANG
ncbi:hypothetical protein GCM10010873_02120 [Cypionkella aquatica]|uniref:Phage holin family protein n=1 Tax=Cypionkella aquatica TaxID=1756042 RepID=A0AA37TZV5_9RHOB|nr:phage holin family protein [Cypionkella aquatica]GLS85239.1 hypothetical protein GCM10010873_02120 [Cypionkella aquatica]